MTELEMQIRDDIRRYGKLLHEKGLTIGRSGNISVKLDPDTFLINRTGADLGSLTDDELILCNIYTDNWKGGASPSIERGFHQGIYRTCPDATAIIHSHPFYSMLVSCSDTPIRTDLFMESMAYLGKVVRVPYFHAGSQRLADEAAIRAKDSQVLILNNHGVVVWGKSLDDCLIKTESLELLCHMQLAAASAGIRLNYLGESTMEEFCRYLKNISQHA
jgi:L-fuculose-phosphate aldolase